MAAIQTSRSRFSAWARSITWLGLLVAAGVATLSLYRADMEFTPQVIIALVGAFALALILVTFSLIAVFIESRDLADLQARLDRLDAEYRDALRQSEEGAVEMGLMPRQPSED